MNISIILTQFLCIFNFLVVTPERIARDAPQELLPQAEILLKEFLTTMSRHGLEMSTYIYPEDDLSNFHLGTPHPVYYMDMENIDSVESAEDFQSTLLFIAWGIPVYYMDEPRTLIRAAKKDGKWVIIDFGGDPTGIIKAQLKWPEAEGYRHSYVFAHIGLDFILVENDNKKEVYLFRERNARYLKLSKGEDGYYPLIKLERVISKCKEDSLGKFKFKKQ